MDDLPRRELINLIARKGIGVCLDPRHFAGELSGLCGGCEKEVFVLATALKKDVISELLRASDTSPVGEKVSRLAGRLHDLGLDRQAAVWAVETWAIALGLAEAVEQPALPEQSTTSDPVEYECPHCFEDGVADIPRRVVCEECGWMFVVDADGTARDPEGLVVVKCPACKEDGQYRTDSESSCDMCDRRLVLDNDGRILNVEVECPNPVGDCGLIHQFMKSELPKLIACESCTWTFEVDAEGKTRTPKGFIDVDCPFCNRPSQHYSAGEVECYQPGCGKTLVIDESGRVVSRTIEAECPRPSCETTQNVEADGQVVCDGCGHKYTIDEDGDVVDPGEGVWEVECENPECKGKFYKDADSEDEHFDGGYECPYCGHWHGHDDEEADEDEDEEADEDGDDELEDEE